MYADGAVGWQQRAQPAPGQLATDAIEALKRIRNNLFHGNEASAAHGYTASALERLLRDAVLVMKTCASLVPTVQAAFDSAALEHGAGCDGSQ
jgi:hypothetical protein